jgi:glutathione S-transferase
LRSPAARYPERPVLPQDPAARVHARAWERTADAYVDATLIDVSYWKWAERDDTMPAGLLALTHGALHGRRKATCTDRRRLPRLRRDHRVVDVRHRRAAAAACLTHARMMA